MKYKMKSLITHIVKYLQSHDEKISIQEFSLFLSILLAVLSLRSQESNKSFTSKYSINNFTHEIELLRSRFPDTVKTFLDVESRLDKKFTSNLLSELTHIFKSKDDDFDDLISWSYQYLKRDLEKNAFHKIGRNKEKIKGADLLYTTQFFTDKYMLRYLVNNSLEKIDREKINDIIVIDPASGGGNFLNYSFECLFYLYKDENPKKTNQSIVDHLLNNAIVGYDLDENLSKIASLSLFVKACSYSVPKKSTCINIFSGSPNDILGFIKDNIDSNIINKRDFQSYLNTDKKKVFVTNPPFMGKRDMDVSLKEYLIKKYPESKADLCSTFIQKILKIKNRDDILGVVSQNNWMFLSSLKGFRSILLNNHHLISCVDLGSNAFEDINGEKTNIALCIIGKVSSKNKSTFYNLKFIKSFKKKRLILENCIPDEFIYKVDQNQFLKNKSLEFNYQLVHSFKNIHNLKPYLEYAKPMQGTSTGNNSKFVKYAWEVNNNKSWKLVSKGGGFSRWSGLNYYKVLWGNNADIIKKNKGSALRNIDKMPHTQLVFSDTGTLGLNVRVLNKDQVFIASGPGILILEGDKYAHLAFLNSRVATFLLKLINPKFTISAGYISKIPVAKNILDSKYIAQKAKKCLKLKEQYLQRKLPNFEFKHCDYENIKNIDLFLESSIIEDIESDFKILTLESDIEVEINKLFNFNTSELIEISNVVGKSSLFNKNKLVTFSIEDIDLFISKHIDLNCFSKGKAISGYSVGSESILELLSCSYNSNSVVILKLVKENISLLKNTKNKYFNDLLHKTVLRELGVIHISEYKIGSFNIEELTKNMKLKYFFLKKKSNLKQDIISIVENHHKHSFFNKPLLSISNKSIIVG